MGDRAMGGNSGRLREEVKNCLLACGAVGVGFAAAEKVELRVGEIYRNWLAQDCHAGMAYMAKHLDIRDDVRLLLDGARSVICMAFSYASANERDNKLPYVAKYALLPDYHKWVRRLVRNSGIGVLLGEEHVEWLLCIDSAPIHERYWAVKSGLGLLGKNGSVIVPGVGPEVVLAEIICTHTFEPDSKLNPECGNCNSCIKSCPTGALSADGTIDCNRCISYLTIEHKGAWKDPLHLEAMNSETGKNTLFGCDRCIRVCPHINNDIKSPIEPHPDMPTFVGINPPAGSCLTRCKSEGLKRNLRSDISIVAPGSIAVESS